MRPSSYQPLSADDPMSDRDRHDALWCAGLTVFIALCAVIVTVAQIYMWIVR